ncbi:hypothetical protein FRC11_002395 [Ceratobasidium sp. 423]|nr:hypothetical protein FRC11_002395 [Ceratobasidium sp. 423]
MIEQIQFMHWAALVDGSHSKRQKERLPSLFKFADIPTDWMPQNQVFGDSTELAPALGAEGGDQWLDSDLAEPNPVQGLGDTQVTSCAEELVDLTSKELIGLFSNYSSSGDGNANLGSESSPEDKALEAEPESPMRVIRRAKDISWD